MSITLRSNQINAINDVNPRFGTLNKLGKLIKAVLCVQPTGGGKSLVIADYARNAYQNGETCIVFAHRDVLITQLSEALCKMGVRHTFLCAAKTQTDITNKNLQEFGDSFYEPWSPVILSSTPTFAKRLKDGKLTEEFLQSVRWWLQDETHHCIQGNQWFNCLTSFPNAQGIGFTATPIRGDKKGLGSHCDGVFDDMSVTVNTFDLIKLDILSPYKVYCTSRVDTTGVKKDSDGDFNKNQLYIKTKEADITGDAVEQYLKHLNGKPVITFCINIEHAKEVAAEFTARGIPSIAVSSKTPLPERQRVLIEFKAGKWLNLVNVDLFGEGYDCPAISGVIMLRKTASFSLYKQQFGRMLRKADGKLFGVLLDHVGNTQSMMVNYGLSHPHDDPAWTLDREIERKKSNTEDGEDDGPVETMECQECHYFGVVGEDFIDGVCPECGHKETEEEQVRRVREIKTQAGELIELPMDVMDELIAKREEMYKPVRDFAQNISDHFAYKRQAVNNHVLRQSALDILRYHIQEWSEKHWQQSGKSHKLVQIDFESTFGINILKAQAMTASQMNDLTMRIKQCLVAV